MNYKMGWVPQKADPRDYSLKHPEIKNTIFKGALPKIVSMLDEDTPIEDQGELGSCTSFAGAGIIQYYAKNNKKVPNVDLSELFLYFWNRYVDNGGSLVKINPKYYPDEDTGSTIRSTAKVLQKMGDCLESDWPYDIKKYNNVPPSDITQKAKAFSNLKYFTIAENTNKIINMKTVLASGIPLMFGSMVSNSIFNVGKNGKEPFEKYPNAGGHARSIFGYNDTISIPGTRNKGAFIVRNSWGKNWGMNGYSYVSYDVFKTQPTDCTGIKV